MADDFYEVLGVESGASEQVRIKKKNDEFYEVLGVEAGASEQARKPEGDWR